MDAIGSERRITRAVLFEGKVDEKTLNTKKIKSDDLESKEEKLTKNMSLISCMSMPPAILKPRHPLPNSWTLWYSAGDKNLSWKKNQIEILTVTTIEDFWLMNNQVQPPSCLPSGHTMSMFRTGIIPDWEHVGNRNGGRWIIDSTKTEKETRDKGWLDKRWMEILFMLMGEHVDPDVARLVVGTEVCVRKKRNRMEVWVGDVSSMDGMAQVGRAIRSELGLKPSVKIQFSIHKEERERIVGARLTM